MTPRDRRPELTVRAPAKVNLSLEVLGRRPDGYHDIRTVMQAVSLFDEMSFSLRADGAVSLRCSLPDLPAGEGNLVVRAARLLRERYAVTDGADVELRKRIPVSGGLGGGSSDAGVAVLALCRLWGLRPPLEELTELAAELGSDVPFFLCGGTALCVGRGERVTPAPCAATLHYVLVMPPCAVATGPVYAASRTRLTGREERSNNVLEALAAGDADGLGRSLHNDLEPAALSLHEELRETSGRLRQMATELGAKGVLLSGSGSSFLVLMGGPREAARAAELLGALEVQCAAVHGLAGWDGCIDMLTLGR